MLPVRPKVSSPCNGDEVVGAKHEDREPQGPSANNSERSLDTIGKSFDEEGNEFFVSRERQRFA